MEEGFFLWGSENRDFFFGCGGGGRRGGRIGVFLGEGHKWEGY